MWVYISNSSQFLLLRIKQQINNKHADERTNEETQNNNQKFSIDDWSAVKFERKPKKYLAIPKLEAGTTGKGNIGGANKIKNKKTFKIKCQFLFMTLI